MLLLAPFLLEEMFAILASTGPWPRGLFGPKIQTPSLQKKRVLVPLIFISNLCGKQDFSSQIKRKEIYMIEFKRYGHRPVSPFGLGIFHLRRDPSTSEERAVRVVHTGHILVSYSFGPNSTNIFFFFFFCFLNLFPLFRTFLSKSNAVYGVAYIKNPKHSPDFCYA